jgi:hypothetical protein
MSKDQSNQTEFSSFDIQVIILNRNFIFNLISNFYLERELGIFKHKSEYE